MKMAIVGASFCEVARPTASAAKSLSRRAVLGYMPSSDRAASMALPYVVHQMTDRRAGGFVLNVFEFILK